MDLHVLALFMVLLGSLVGMCFPILAGKLGGRDRLQAYILPLAKTFGAGVILATGLVHMMVPAFDAFSQTDCLPAVFSTYEAFASASPMHARNRVAHIPWYPAQAASRCCRLRS
jgi:zinc transporter 1/2/3